MRASPEIRPHLLAARMKRWLDILRCPLINTKVPTWKARRNYRHLVRRYPEIATALGYSEALSFPSPLHGLWSPVQLQPAAPQEFLGDSLNTGVTNPAPVQQFAEQITVLQPEPAAAGLPRMISLADEVL
jgi:hypothetical protein